MVNDGFISITIDKIGGQIAMGDKDGFFDQMED